MLASGRTGIVCRIVLLVSLLVVVTTLTLIMHAVMSNRRSFLQRAPARQDAFSKASQPVGGGGGRSERGLMALIANVTKTVIAMEMQATSLNDELKSMREKTRELLLQQRHTALWTVLHKCVFYSCKDQTAVRSFQHIGSQGNARATPKSSASAKRTTEKKQQTVGAKNSDDSVVSVQKIERKYSMYRLRRHT